MMKDKRAVIALNGQLRLFIATNLEFMSAPNVVNLLVLIYPMMMKKVKQQPMTTTTQLNDTWQRMLGHYDTSRQAIDRVRRLEADRKRRAEYRVGLDRESGKYYIEFRRKF